MIVAPRTTSYLSVCGSFFKVSQENDGGPSTGSETCFWISDNPELKSRFPGSEGQRALPHSLAGGWSGCGIEPAVSSVSGVLVGKVVSSDALTTWIPLDSDSCGSLVNLTSVWAQL